MFRLPRPKTSVGERYNVLLWLFREGEISREEFFQRVEKLGELAVNKWGYTDEIKDWLREGAKKAIWWQAIERRP